MSRRKLATRPWRWRVRELIEEKGLSIREVARRAGVSPATIRAFRTDPQHETTIAVLMRLAEALEVSHHDLLEMAEYAPEGEDHNRDLPSSTHI